MDDILAGLAQSSPYHGDMTWDAVLFDCDGVLVDSEPITNRVLREMLIEQGWAISADDCEALFIGHTVRTRKDLIEAQTGKPFTDEWLHSFYERRNQALRVELKAIPGALQAVQAAHAFTGGRIACASGADRPKVVMQLQMAGMTEWFGKHVYSGHETPRSKPFPDVYLAAAAALEVDPRRCLVIEDTITGVQAGLAAGATVWAYTPAHSRQQLAQSGVARCFSHMDELSQALSFSA
jgi:HAD superfamily hydrolase (TIGR01509 family)